MQQLSSFDVDFKIKGRIDEIEVLRAIAILFVLFGHLPTLLFWGNEWHTEVTNKLAFWPGVDLFFCISGFVIGCSLWPKLGDISQEDYWPTVIGFWIRRAYRLLPSTWLWLAIVLIGTIFFNHSGSFGYLWGNFADTVASILNFQNFHFASCMENIGSHVCGNNGIYWSLSLEEQFYLFFPLLFLLPRKYILIRVMIESGV